MFASGPCLIFEWQKRALRGVLHIPPLSGPAGTGALGPENGQGRSAREKLAQRGKECIVALFTLYSLDLS